MDHGPSAALAFLDACPPAAGIVILADWEEDAKLGRQACLSRGLVPQKNASARTVGYLCIPSASALLGVASVRATKMRDKGATMIDWGPTLTSPGATDMLPTPVAPRLGGRPRKVPNPDVPFRPSPPVAKAHGFSSAARPAPPALVIETAESSAANAAQLADAWAQLPVTPAGAFVPIDILAWRVDGLPFTGCPPLLLPAPILASDLPPDCKRVRVADDLPADRLALAALLGVPESRNSAWVPYPTRIEGRRLAGCLALRGQLRGVTAIAATCTRAYTVSLLCATAATTPSHTVTIGANVTCSCGDLSACDHRVFVFCRVLKVPSASPFAFQRALLTSERRRIFAAAPDRLKQQYLQCGEAECPTCCELLVPNAAAPSLQGCGKCRAHFHATCYATSNCIFCF